MKALSERSLKASYHYHGPHDWHIFPQCLTNIPLINPSFLGNKEIQSAYFFGGLGIKVVIHHWSTGCDNQCCHNSALLQFKVIKQYAMTLCCCCLCIPQRQIYYMDHMLVSSCSTLIVSWNQGKFGETINKLERFLRSNVVTDPTWLF